MIILLRKSLYDSSSASIKEEKIRLMRRYAMLSEKLFLDSLAQMHFSIFQLAKDFNKTPREVRRDVRNSAVELFCRLHPGFITNSDENIPIIL